MSQSFPGKVFGNFLAYFCFGFVHVKVGLNSGLDGATFRLTHLSAVRQG